MEISSCPSVTWYEHVNDQVDIYCPTVKNSTLVPVVFYIHGGAWHLGNKTNAQPPCRLMASKGYVTVAPSYPLSSMSNSQIEVALTVVLGLMLVLAVTTINTAQLMLVLILTAGLVMFVVLLWMYVPRENVQHPQHVQELARTFKWTVDHISEYGGDPNRIFVMGHSAGGHLASLLSTNFHYLKEAGVSHETVKGCIAISGVYSDKRMQQTRLGSQLLLNAFGDHEDYSDAFPIYNLSAQTPPFLLLNAGLDASLKRHTLDFHNRLRRNGTFVETSYFDYTNHYNIVLHWDQQNSKVLDKIESFMNEVLEYLNTPKTTDIETNNSEDTKLPASQHLTNTDEHHITTKSNII